MVTHSSILAWRITWTEKPGRRSSWGHRTVWTWLSNQIMTTKNGLCWIMVHHSTPRDLPNKCSFNKNYNTGKDTGIVLGSRLRLILGREYLQGVYSGEAVFSRLDTCPLVQKKSGRQEPKCIPQICQAWFRATKLFMTRSKGFTVRYNAWKSNWLIRTVLYGY